MQNYEEYPQGREIIYPVDFIVEERAYVNAYLDDFRYLKGHRPIEKKTD